jgi:tetratricopeptide (TPR) repeat protein
MGFLYRSFLIEKRQGDRYSIVPLVGEFLRNLRRETTATVGGVPVAVFIQQSYRRLADYYVSTLRVVQRRVDSTLLILKVERKNIWTIMEWCYQEGVHEPMLELLEFIGPSLDKLRYLLDRKQWAERAIEVCEKLGRLEQAAWFRVRDLAWTLVRMGTDASRQEGTKILDNYNDVGAQKGWNRVQALALRNLGLLAMEQEDYVTAHSLLEQSLAIWKEAGDDQWYLLTKRYLADTLVHLGQIDSGLSMLREMVSKHAEAGDLDSQIGATNSAAIAYALQNKCGEARRLYENSRQLATTIQEPSWALAEALSVASRVEEMCGNIPEAIEFELRALGIHEMNGMPYYITESRERIQALRDKETMG